MREYAHAEQLGVPGSKVFNTERNWALICACIREALEASTSGADAVTAVSTTSMREGMVLYDARGREIWACPNVDSRAGEEAVELVQTGAAQEIYEHSGDWVAITAPARFLWIAQHEPAIFAAIAHVGMLGDWILTRLCGAFATDPSLGSSSGMFELSRRMWSEHVIELVGLEPIPSSAVSLLRRPRRQAFARGRRASSVVPIRSSASSGSGSSSRTDSRSSAARSGSTRSSSTSR
ncbi:MAG: hypothetical protein E6G14_04840 [Actinobacteria bacterium]|nr:MAG: hypothetical protein E6G14_04840 [Actinomycetota bacterium]